MAFTPSEVSALLALKGVGPAIIKRLEQIGCGNMALLAESSAEQITLQISEAVGSTCWRNSPQARASIQACIDYAQSAAVSNE